MSLSLSGSLVLSLPLSLCLSGFLALSLYPQTLCQGLTLLFLTHCSTSLYFYYSLLRRLLNHFFLLSFHSFSPSFHPVFLIYIIHPTVSFSPFPFSLFPSPPLLFYFALSLASTFSFSCLSILYLLPSPSLFSISLRHNHFILVFPSFSVLHLISPLSIYLFLSLTRSVCVSSLSLSL